MAIVEGRELKPKSTVVTVTVHQGWPASPRGVQQPLQPDLVVSANDAATIFHVHHKRLAFASANNMHGTLPESIPVRVGAAGAAMSTKDLPLINLPYSSAVLHLVLLGVYDASSPKSLSDREGPVTVHASEDDDNASFADLSDAMNALEECGVPLEKAVSESSQLYSMLSAQCHRSAAIDVYVLAASHAPHLHHLAIHASSFLVSFDYAQLTEELAMAMGSLYTLRLYQMLFQRTAQFKSIILLPPDYHGATRACDTKDLEDAWRIAMFQLMVEAAPSVRESVLDGAKNAVIGRISCGLCKASLEQWLADLKHDWALARESHI